MGPIFPDSIPEPLMLLTPDLVIDTLNMPAQQFWGRSQSAIVGKGLADILGPNKELSDLCQRAVGSLGGVRAFDVDIDRRFLGGVQCDVSASVFDDVGRILLLLMPRTGPSQAQSLNPDLRASEGLHHLVSMLAHEIKNPLAGIKGAAQLIEMSADSSDGDLGRLIVEEADRLAALVDQFDFFSNSVQTEMEAVNLHEILVRVETIARNSFGKHVVFERRYDPSLPEAWGDKDRLVQVLLNIIKNACEALNDVEPATIVLTTRYEHGNVIMANGGHSSEAPLTISVRDNGPGIPAEMQSQIFEPFRTGKVNGTGLGLSIVTKILADHRAAIEFTSASGGTDFTLRFPRQARRAGAAQQNDGARPIGSGDHGWRSS